MNSKDLDKIFQDAFSKEMSFPAKEHQWQDIHSRVRNRRKWLAWILPPVLCLMIIGTWMYSSQAYSTRQTSQSLANTSILHEKKTKSLATPEEHSEFNVKEVSSKNIESKPTLHSNSDPSVVKEISKIKNSTLPVDTYAIPSKKSTIDKKSIHPSYSLLNDKADLKNESKVNQEFIDYSGSFSNKYLQKRPLQFLNFKKDEIELHLPSKIVLTDIKKKDVPIPSSLFIGLNYAIQPQTSLEIQRPWSYQFGYQQSISRHFALLASYRYQPWEVLATNNFNQYEIQYLNVYEPGDWINTQVKSVIHALHFGLKAQKPIGNWHFNAAMHSRTQLITNRLEQHRFATIYQQIEIEESEKNTWSTYEIYPSIGISYKYQNVQLSLDYEYYFPRHVLYRGSGIQSINFLIHYNLN